MKRQRLGFWATACVGVCAAAGFLLAGCNREIEYNRSDNGLYPMDSAGTYRVYDVYFQRWEVSSIGGIGDTNVCGEYFVKIVNRYRKMERNDSLETDLKDRVTRRLHILHAERDSVTGEWGEFAFHELWTQYKDELFAERIEGNIKYKVLRFPPRTDRPWNGNEFNDQGEQEYRYLNVDSTVTLNGRTFEGCAVVRQRLIDELLTKAETVEIYAPGVGKIYRRDVQTVRDRKYNQDNSFCDQLLTDTYVYEERLVDQNLLP